MFLRPRTLLTTALLSLLPLFAHADDQPPPKVDINDVVRELQKLSHSDDRMRLVWWIPDEYWRASAGDKPGMDQVVKVLQPYILIAVVDGQISQFGGFTFAPESETRHLVKIYDAAGNAYSPLDPKEISVDAKNILGFMRPVFANAMGDLGKNIVFLVYPRKGLDGKPIANTMGQGKFQVRFAGEDFTYRLPLAAFSPKMKCANDPELFPIYYKFCPYDGSPMVPANP